MSTTEYVLNATLVLVVVLQLRGRRLEGWSFITPFAVVAFVASKYLRSIPTGGNDLLLIGLGVTAGLTLGILCGLFTLVYRREGALFARATGIAAVLWILGIGARVAFSLYATHGGGPSIARFSAAHSLTMDAWVDALVLMALCEVVSRSTLLILRSRRLSGGYGGAIIPAA